MLNPRNPYRKEAKIRVHRENTFADEMQWVDPDEGIVLTIPSRNSGSEGSYRWRVCPRRPSIPGIPDDWDIRVWRAVLVGNELTHVRAMAQDLETFLEFPAEWID